MLRTVSTAELCAGLGLSRARLDQLISRGLIAPTHDPDPGKPRAWRIEDALRVAVFIDLADTYRLTLDRTVSDDLVARLNARLSAGRVGLFQNGRTFLLISKETLSLVSTSKRGERAKPSVPAGLTDQVYPRIVSETGLLKELAQAGHSPAIVIDLSAMERRLLTFWPKADAE